MDRFKTVVERIDATRWTRRHTMVLSVVGVCMFVAIAALAGSGHRGATRASSDGSAASSKTASLGFATAAPGALPGPVTAPGLAPVQAPGGLSAEGQAAGTSTGSSGVGAGVDSSSASVGGAAPPVVTTSSDDSTRIVQNGSISLEVAKGAVSATASKVESIAASLGGRVASSKASTYGDNPAASLTLRVPVQRFGQAMSRVSALGKVLDSSSSGDDVSSQYTDEKARLHALEASRSTYLTLLAKANNIGEVLSVQQRIDGVQQQIESLQGQIKLLTDQSDLSTVTVSISEKGATAVQPLKERSGINKAFHDAIHGFNTGVENIVAGSGTALLVALCLLVIVAALKVAYAIARRRTV